VVLNKSNKSVQAQLKVPAVYGVKSGTNLLTNEKVDVVDNNINLTIPPGSYSFYRLEE
jgi:hypothetical protein